MRQYLLLLLLLLLLLPLNLAAQKHDYFWFFGGGGSSSNDDEYGIRTLDFSSKPFPALSPIMEDYNINLRGATTSICDVNGNLLFYTNGEKINNYQHKLMENGNWINKENEWGENIPNSVLILPWPEKPNLYYLLNGQDTTHINNNNSGLITYTNTIYKNLIDMSRMRGLGEVIFKKTPLITGKLASGKITAVKHANGRDWWVMIPEYDSNRYFIYLLDKTGIKLQNTQAIGNTVEDGLGMAFFSPDGSKYIRTDAKYLGQPPYFNIYDFDRCSGRLSNQRAKVMPFGRGNFGLGGAVSPDSRYLYIMKTYDIYQYDLKAADIFGSEKIVAVHDGFLEDDFWVTGFFTSQLGPDGRIYVAASVNTKSLHRINFPNRAGTACQIQQRVVPLKVYNQYNTPNIPNFRLGPLDGSPCDTLGLNNNPVADFRWDMEDTLAPLRVTFTDLSAYEPSAWAWDFGDGRGRSTTQEPVYTFPRAGTYRVCLTASNRNSGNTVCYNVQVGQTVSSSEPELAAAVSYTLRPNPANEAVFFNAALAVDKEHVVEVYNAMGQLLQSQRIAVGQDNLLISTNDWSNGLYFYRVREEGRLIQSGTFNIQH